MDSQSQTRQMSTRDCDLREDESMMIIFFVFNFYFWVGLLDQKNLNRITLLDWYLSRLNSPHNPMQVEVSSYDTEFDNQLAPWERS